MGEEVAVRNPVEVVCATIADDAFKSKVAQAVPPGVSVERFVRTTLTAVQQNPEVVTADRGSLYNAVIRAAQDGLLPDGREAALVIFNTQGKKKVQYLPMIGGLRKRAAEHGFAIDAFVVYENDEFHYELGFEPVVVHRPPRLGEERGKVLGAYAVATRLSDGRKFLEPPMSVAEIEAIRSRSRAKDKGPWVTDWTEMARKTVARRLFKSLPLVTDELTGRVLEASDSEFEKAGSRMTVDEANVAAGIGELTPPGDAGPDDGPADEPEVIEGHAVLVEDDDAPSPESEGEPAAASPDASASAEPTAAPDGSRPEPGSSSDTPPEEAQGSIFEQQAAAAQQRKRARGVADG